MVTVREIHQIEELEALRLHWMALWQQTPAGNFFQTLDWLQVYWRHYGDQQQLRVLLVVHGGKLIGILPLTVIREATRIGRVRVLTYPLHDWGAAYGPIGPQPTVTLLTAMRHLVRQRPSWDLVDLRWIVPSVDRGRTEAAMRVAGFAGWTGTWQTTSLVDCGQGWRAYLASRSEKFRHNLRRANRQARNLGHLRFERHRPAGAMQGDSDPRWDLFEACCLVAQRSWQATSDRGTTMSDKQINPFLRDAHRAAVRLGAADVNLLWFNETPIAYAYNYAAQRQLFGLRMGFDAAFAKLSPGRLLLGRMIEDSCQRGDEVLDMGPGFSEAKRRWRTREQCIERCSHYLGSSAKAQLLRWKRAVGFTSALSRAPL